MILLVARLCLWPDSACGMILSREYDSYILRFPRGEYVLAHTPYSVGEKVCFFLHFATVVLEAAFSGHVRIPAGLLSLPL